MSYGTVPFIIIGTSTFIKPPVASMVIDPCHVFFSGCPEV